ncbi:hypothetical protein FRC07_011676 [Ceratobasidium sp. 392]|nr:hypothetical protein FRC07_011676 [Ceratobasidium sp. 392]
MMFMNFPRLIAAAALFSFAGAQIPTSEGSTVVASSNPVTDPGAPAQSTVAPTSPAPAPVPGVTTTPVATSAPAVPTSAAAPTATTSTPRVVGAPGPTGGDPGPTTYRYTTTDANGATTVIIDTYTPSYGVITSTPIPSAGSIMPYDQYTSLYGGGSGGTGGKGLGSSAVRQYTAVGTGVTAAVVMCILGGVTMLL